MRNRCFRRKGICERGAMMRMLPPKDTVSSKANLKGTGGRWIAGIHVSAVTSKMCTK